jgi:Ca-activated chloride channel homolog
MDFRNISFEYPEALLLFILFIICHFFCKRLLSTKYFPHLNLFSKSLGFLNIEKFIKIFIALLLTIALASPVLIDKRHPNNRNGMDVALVLDSSNSMDEVIGEGDEAQQKYGFMQQVVSAFIAQRENDNVALIMFADFAYIASPLTYEKEILIDFFKMQTMGMAGKNTAIGDGIATGISALKSSQAKSKIMIVLSDGEQNSGKVSIEEAVTIAAQRGIKIYVIGFGNEEAINHTLMQRIANESSGAYFFADSPTVLEEVFDEIDTLSSSAIKARNYVEKEYLFFYFAFTAFLLMIWLVGRQIRGLRQ